MDIGGITSYIDVAQLVLYAFWLFFAGLIFYLRREDRREGYPLLSEVDGRPMNHGVIYVPEPKTFTLANGQTVKAPRDTVDTREIHAKPREPWTGAPLEPTGNPMIDGVGPAAYALRADVVDVTFHGAAKIVPMRVATDYHLPMGDADPRGMAVVGADRQTAGNVRDLWVDRSEQLIRYLEIEVSGSDPVQTVLLPMNFALIDKRRRVIKVEALMARHFADVPGLKSPDQVTFLEEERICAYYGGGTLFASPARREPML